VEAERVQPDETDSPSHDAFTRQLHRLFPSTDRLWSEVREHIDLKKGCFICDDSTLDKFYSRKIELVDPSLVRKTQTGRIRYQFNHAALDGW
jgi:hypothetical protein